MQLHRTQSEVAKDNHDYRVVCCGRQWGKTTLAVLEMVACAYAKGGRRIAYFATTYDQARNIAWAFLKDYSRSIWVKPPNESRLELTVKTQDGGTSEISLRGFENIETARGQQFDLLVIDEVAYMKNWKYAWEAILEPTLAFRNGKALFISTPQGFNFFYDMYNRGQEDNVHWKSWRFTSYDNPHLPNDRIEQAKEQNTPDYFAQEYMADFRTATGLAHKMWDRSLHLIEPFEIPKTWDRARGFDFGSDDPTSSVRVAISPDDDWYVERCYKKRGMTTSEHAEAIIAQDYGLPYVPKWGDPSGLQWFKDMEFFKVYIMPASKEMKQQFRGWVENCVERVNELLRPRPGHLIKLTDREIQDAPRLFVIKTPENMEFVSEIEQLKWKTTTSGETLPSLEDAGDPNGHFDLMAAMRYLAVSYKKQSKAVEVPYERRKWGVYGGGAYS